MFQSSHRLALRSQAVIQESSRYKFKLYVIVGLSRDFVSRIDTMPQIIVLTQWLRIVLTQWLRLCSPMVKKFECACFTQELFFHFRVFQFTTGKLAFNKNIAFCLYIQDEKLFLVYFWLVNWQSSPRRVPQGHLTETSQYDKIENLCDIIKATRWPRSVWIISVLTKCQKNLISRHMTLRSRRT